jgi:aspartate/methionine/tyrosine aminotransferase
VVYLYGFSKVYRTPEIRVSFVMLHDPIERATSLFSDIKKIANLSFGVNPRSQIVATKLLEESSDLQRRQFEEIQHRRGILNKAIAESDNLYSIPAKGATYQLLEPPWEDWEVCQRLVCEHGILSTPGSVYDPFIGPDYVRVVFLNTPENLINFVTCLDKIA